MRGDLGPRSASGRALKSLSLQHLQDWTWVSKKTECCRLQWSPSSSPWGKPRQTRAWRKASTKLDKSWHGIAHQNRTKLEALDFSSVFSHTRPTSEGQKPVKKYKNLKVGALGHCVRNGSEASRNSCYEPRDLHPSCYVGISKS